MHGRFVVDDCSTAMHAILVADDCPAAMENNGVSWCLLAKHVGLRHWW